MLRYVATVSLVLALGVSSVAGSRASPPALRIVENSVRGVHFRPNEKVRVVFDKSGTHRVRRVRTSAVGSFKTALVSFDPCLESLEITAVGPGGERARLKLPQRACPPSLATPG